MYQTLYNVIMVSTFFHQLFCPNCRLLKKLKKKDEQQIELEKKEQGFSIYVNGANVELGKAYTRAKSRSSSRHTKTAGGGMSIVKS